MKTKVEGIVLSKTPFRERDLICRLLLRNGQKTSVVFFGGQGGGARRKSSPVELGNALKIELAYSRKTDQDLFTCREYIVHWQHEQIRNQHRAFFLLCFFLEVIDRLSLQYDPYQEGEDFDHDEGLYRVLSNALYFLDQDVQCPQFDWQKHAFLFLSKLVFDTGVAPELESCLYCEKELNLFSQIVLSADQGGFICEHCSEKESVQLDDRTGRDIWQLLKQIRHLPYKDYEGLRGLSRPLFRHIFHYFCFQHHFRPEQFRSFSSL